MKYEIEYKSCKVAYTSETLDAHKWEHGVPVLEDDHDYLAAAAKYFCATHFMDSSAARLEQFDAATRGREWQEWQYQPNGTFKGWIHAVAREE